MDIQITFRHMEHTPALDELIRDKSHKFSKWFGDQAQIKWVCWVDGKDQYSEVSIHSGHKEYFAKAHSDDLYKTVDLVIHKIHNQLG
jgi:putative sigma-54 modulation protein